MSKAILTLNSGSSSLKFAVFGFDATQNTPGVSGKVTGIGGAPEFSARGGDGEYLAKGILSNLNTTSSHEDIIAHLLTWLPQHLEGRPLIAIGHRVVHGGSFFAAPTLVTNDVLDKLKTLIPLAPLHQPHNLAAIRAVTKWHPEVPQIACFDTAFHRTQDRLASLFALPRSLSDEGIMRYGFHGLSYEYIASVLPQHLGSQADGRVIVAHLGNGASMCAMTNRQSVATSMGFTALDGLMMGSRCGTLDPGVVLYLMQSKGMTASQVEEMLYRQSGLLGVSGISNNMQVLQNSSDPHAREAIELYCFRAASILAGLVSAIGGLDALVFTAGTGENSALVRKLTCDRLAWMGLHLDAEANDKNQITLSSSQSTVAVLRLPTNEEAVVAEACRSFVTNNQIQDQKF
ncbi:acetate kinase [Sulfitobacter marinus]|uniref:Acetate kinase n=1 Tax=Sulfitobacter marinus TaxID=394264 RepID=A0A1I6UJJ8_9RHOB|nr:acetate/propionate family kinase [Sulfitobacter marinus]SFT01646.1 acetate kinase [Sulfitobacter marinus]